MHSNLCVVVILAVCTGLLATGCATKRCLESYAIMTTEQAVRQDGVILTALVEHRRAVVEEANELSESNSEMGDYQRSVQAWEMGIAVVVQLQNLARREEHADALQEHRELVTSIRCLATSWAFGESHTIGSRDGMEMLEYQRSLETEFGDRGRPTDTQLSAIVEGREIFMGPAEEQVDVPQADEGTGPSQEDETEGGEEGSEGEPTDGSDASDGDEEGGEDDINADIDDLLGD